VSAPDKALNFLIGAVMRETQGRANPHVVRALILERVFPDAPAPEVST
jgi:Asp-tRNA(Asn)/Glu-tRNA(Gln) amidotransferase B subunit